MPSITVECQNDECTKFNEYECEWESCGEGTTHELKCECGTITKFEIEYVGPVAGNERPA